MNTNKKNKTIISITIIVSILIAFSLGLGIYTNKTKQKSKLNPTVSNMTQLIQLNQKQKTIDEFSAEYYYNPDCKDCQFLEKNGIKDQLKAAKKTNEAGVSLINLSEFIKAKDESKSISQWTTDNQIVQTPTLVIKYKGYPIYTYAGTDDIKIIKLLSNKNPQTNETFKKEIPEKQTYDNEFTNQNTKIKSIPLIETKES